MHKNIIKKFDTDVIGKTIIHYEKIDSTQKEIWRRIEENNIKDGTVITADIQTDGIGTHGRKWYTSEEKNIAFSFVIFLNVKVKQLENLTTKIAEILVSIFENTYHIKLEIKKPNDLMIKGKKVGGILTQTKLQGEIVKNLVIGIGINTNQSDFEQEIETIATSVKKEFCIIVNNKMIIQKFIYEFEKVMKNII